MKSVRQELGSGYFHQGYNCSQSVVMAFEDLIGSDRETLAKLSVGLGGGVGRMREVCGCVSGMAIVIGMLRGTDDPMSRNTVYPLVQKACERFKEENGSIVCHDLLSQVPHTDGGTAQPRTQEYYRKRPCAELVGMAIGITEEILCMN
ncbi:MAG: C-GCAxxG-C-C family protein [Lachnospiraceae bacterium]|nr:C-GCAxxG-C-C family protein [Lachnospiraceae bacterium]